ncbi:MAG: endonuclease [Phycisphaerales bacterium JB043]
MSRLVCVCAGAAVSIAGVSNADPWAPPVGYYSGATGTGATLKSQLFSIMSSGHILRNYGSVRFSSAITDADPDTPGNILLMYNRASVSSTWDSGSTWNREHVWPQSLQPASASNGTANAASDAHSLRPCNPTVNSQRSNQPFGLDFSTGLNADIGAYYFPGDSDKGDAARILFYFETRWGPSEGVQLINGLPSGFQMGDLASLIAWHYLDVPDEFERRRNHTIYSSAYNPTYYTNNRNAFIDHPEYVWSIWVDQNNDSQLSVQVTPAGDGGSSALVQMPGMLVGSSTPPEVTLPLFNFGFDPTYYDVSVSGEATSENEGSLNAFAINGSGSDIHIISVGIDTATPGVVGLKTGQVVIDNLDITSGEGLGRAAQDANDTIDIELAVLDHAEASFASGFDQNTTSFDLGTIALGGGDSLDSVDVFNLEATPGFTAGLDITLAGSSGDTGALVVDTTSLAAIASGSSDSLSVRLVDDNAGSFSATYTFDTGDDATLHGAASGDQIVLTLTGSVGASCYADLNGDGFRDGADLGLLLGNWGSPGSSDLNNDGTTDGADLGLMLGAWGACP